MIKYSKLSFLLLLALGLVACNKTDPKSSQDPRISNLNGRDLTCIEGHGYPSRYIFSDQQLRIVNGDSQNREESQSVWQQDGNTITIDDHEYLLIQDGDTLHLQYDKEQEMPEDLHCEAYDASKFDTILENHYKAMAESQ